ncbi:MAG: hypothetical protein H3C64_10020 [Candidatus Kuenenia stuttgartiensis]|nr:hypothetical protein [Candidatus Kuenenia stuttgartiensis]
MLFFYSRGLGNKSKGELEVVRHLADLLIRTPSGVIITRFSFTSSALID